MREAQVLGKEQDRLLIFGQPEQTDRGLFGWIF
ncbi:MAG: hypothetical protein A4E36_00257 [Methanoregulaceae archaeon PtaB.Bin009]|jgi:hypothetical protein|nr:MAG: hypothetical protein A4E36_00257 [Methanoregulaceae archaeon PtaB.Bin009]OPY40686.1 MAG: hypothetical protein A4E41_01247 [Methanoregulaceae archaeon PtaU1.Bin066]